MEIEMTKVGSLASGRLWALVPSAQKCVTQDQGDHLILLIPRDIRELGGDALRRDEIATAERNELFGVADALAEQLSAGLGRPGYYRLEINGPAAASRNHLHIHIIGGRVGTKFRRCVDPIVQ